MGSLGHTFPVGSKVWVPDASESWLEGKVIASSLNSIEVVVEAQEKKRITVDPKACFAKEDEGGIVDDMVKLSYLHEPGVLYNLYFRYQRNLIYTYTGSILIALNPFMRVPGLYSQEMKEEYKGKQLGELSPHVFAIADNAYRSMIDDKKSQSILISGESGAGKTETTKLVMEYLAGVGGRAKEGEKRSIESQVLESNPLLEAFGNAKTVRNDNSSRFGKFIEIQFDKFGKVSGAAIRSYLLERSRVVCISDPERNYHCFYQLCDGASDEEIKKFHLPPTNTASNRRAAQFYYLKQSKCLDLEGKRTNKEEYEMTRAAMDVVGLSKEEQVSVFRVVAAILHLGNINLKQKGDELEIADEKSKKHFEHVVELLECDPKFLLQSLTTVTRKVGREVIRSFLPLKLAVARRDTLAKTIYSKLFDWIVEKVNSSIGQDENSMLSIGVLDIYGFEHFKNNSFEQFCINLANEKLQQHFNQHVLKLEQEEYEREAINWSYIDFVDNQDVLDLIEGNQGILAFLDSGCKLATTTPDQFARTLYENFNGKNKRFSKGKGSVTDFTLNHYAGNVKYLTDEFLVKNMDSVIPDHEQLLMESNNEFVKNLFPPKEEEEMASDNLRSMRAGAKFESLGRRFKLQLAALMETLNKTEPHYIRCVKPNSKSKPFIFEKLSVMDQLRSGGVLEAIRMCSAGYPTRRTFDDFIYRFGLLTPKILDKEPNETKLVELMLKETALTNYQIGKTKVFLRAGQMVHLENLRTEKMNKMARMIQRNFRLYVFRLKRKRAAIVIQKYWRRYHAMKKFVHMRQELAAIEIQRNERRRQARKRFLLMKHSAVVIQAAFRSYYMREKYNEMRRENAARKMQRCWRGFRSRRPYLALKRFVRAKVSRIRFKRLRKEAARIAELAPPRKKTDVAVETIRMMVLRLMRDKAERNLASTERQLLELKEELEKKSRDMAKRDMEIQILQTELKMERERSAKAEQELLKVAERGEETMRDKEGESRGGEGGREETSVPSIQVVDKRMERLGSSLGSPYKSSPRSAPSLPPVFEVPPSAVDLSTERARGARVAFPSSTSVVPSPALSAVPPPTAAAGAPAPSPSSAPKFKKIQSMAIRTGSDMGRPQPLARPSIGSANMDKILTSMQKEVEVAVKLKGENKWLKTAYKDAVSSLEKERESVREALERNEELERALVLKDERIADCEDRMKHLQQHLASKTQEIKSLSSKLLVVQAATEGPQMPVDKQQDVLLEVVHNPLGFSSSGKPIAACIMYKSLIQWKTFQTEKTNTFDRVVETFQKASRHGDVSTLSYWLTNHAVLYFLVHVVFKPEDKPKALQNISMAFSFFATRVTPAEPYTNQVDLSLFKQQLATGVDRLFVTLRDEAKNEIQQILSFNLQQGGGGKEATTNIPAVRTLGRSSSVALRRHVVSYWNSLVVCLKDVMETLKNNFVPSLLTDCLIRQLLQFIDVKVFNSLMVRSQWCPCTYSNGETMDEGLSKIDRFLHQIEPWLRDELGRNRVPFKDELSHIRQAVDLLTMDHKPRRKLDDIQFLCPDLSLNQLVHICIWYEDDKYGTKGVDPSVIENMYALMGEDEDNPVLLKENEDIPYTIDELMMTMKEFDLESIEPPPELQEDLAFHFLIPTYTGSMTQSHSTAAGASHHQGNPQGFSGSSSIAGGVRPKTAAGVYGGSVGKPPAPPTSPSLWL